MKSYSRYQERLRARNLFIHHHNLGGGGRYTNEEGRTIPKPLSVLESMVEDKQKARASVENNNIMDITGEEV